MAVPPTAVCIRDACRYNTKTMNGTSILTIHKPYDTDHDTLHPVSVLGLV